MQINLTITATKIIFYRNKLDFSDQINLKCDVKGYIILRCLRYKEHASCARSALTACARGMIKTHNMELFRSGQHAEAVRYAGTFVTSLEGKPVRGVNNDNVKHSNTQHTRANPIVVHGHRNNKQHINTQHTQADTGAVHGQRRATVTVLYFALTSKS